MAKKPLESAKAIDSIKHKDQRLKKEDARDFLTAAAPMRRFMISGKIC